MPTQRGAAVVDVHPVSPLAPDPHLRALLPPGEPGPTEPPELGLLDPKNDFVFKTMLTGRLAYYLARDFVDQLRRGKGYDRLTPSAVIVWLPKPLFPELDELHSIFELRERRRSIVFGEHLSIHVLQLSALPSPAVTGYDVLVERWGRFFAAYDDPETLTQLAAEDPIMAVATQTLTEISQDPALRRLAVEREDAQALHWIELEACREEGWTAGRDAGWTAGRDAGWTAGRDEGRAMLLLEQLEARFGPPSEATQARVRAGTAAELRAWGLRVLGATCLDEVLGG